MTSSKSKGGSTQDPDPIRTGVELDGTPTDGAAFVDLAVRAVDADRCADRGAEGTDELVGARGIEVRAASDVGPLGHPRLQLGVLEAKPTMLTVTSTPTLECRIRGGRIAFACLLTIGDEDDRHRVPVTAEKVGIHHPGQGCGDGRGRPFGSLETGDLAPHPGTIERPKRLCEPGLAARLARVALASEGT